MDKQINRKKWTWLRVAIIVVVFIAVGVFIREFYRTSKTSTLNVNPDRILVDTVSKGSFQEFIPVTGVVLPIKNVLIGAIEGGRVEEKFVEDGSMVIAGQPILHLSNPDLELNYLNQEATIVSQINQIRNTSLMMEQQSLSLKENAIDVDYRIDLLSKRVDRNKELFKSGIISEVEFQETKDEYESLLVRKELLRRTVYKDSLSTSLQQQQMEASLDLMERNLVIARKSLDNLIVKAPIDGQLSGLDVELGEMVIEGSHIAQIDNLSNFKVRVQIDEFYISRIFTDQQGSFIFAGQNYDLHIQKIYPQVTSGTFEADMLFNGDRPEGIKRGQTVSVKLALSAQEEALLVSRGSFYQSTGGNWIYLIDPSGKVARRKDIRIGRQNPNFFEILEGLNPGDVVITSSYENYQDTEELILH